MKYKNPYDPLANSILNRLDLDDNNLPDDLLNWEDKSLSDKIPAREDKEPRSSLFKKLEAELDKVMRDFERSQGRISLEAFKKRVTHWEHKVQNTKLKPNEKDRLLASGTMARHFSDLWS
ncbi:MAG: hypothetical protein HC880_00085 [Bacteroidia bacterium]|nr:hypothetical protein [Bacteroidia bacterium]